VSVPLFDASIPVYLQMLNNVDAILEKAEGHAREQGRQPESFLEARLAPDMHPLSRQIQMISDAAKGGAARLAGLVPPSMPDEETTWAELRDRVARTIAFVETIRPEQVNGREEAVVELQVPGRTLTFTGKSFLFQFSLPNFFFHATIAYGLLRSQGVPLGKIDFLAGRMNL
jgi:uncharacterized protein